MKSFPTEVELRDWASQAVNAKTHMEMRLAVMVLLQQSLGLRAALEMVMPEDSESGGDEC